MPTKRYTDIQHVVRGVSDILTFALDNQSEAVSPIEWHEFFQLLYVKRSTEDEQALWDVFEKADHMCLLVAPRGGGKTTSLLSALREYKKSPSAGAFLFDFMANSQLLYGIETDWPVQLFGLQEIMRTELLDQEIEADTDLNYRFVASALEAYFKQRVIALDLELREQGEANLSNRTLLDALQHRPDIARRENTFVKSKLTFGQLVQIVKALKGYSRYMVCFDNVDRLSADIQPYLLSFAIDSYFGGKGAYGTLVALREKNVMRYQEAGAGANIIRIIALTGVAEDVERLDVPPPEESFVEQLFVRRQDYARDIYIPERLRFKDEEFDVFLTGVREHVNTEFIAQKLHGLANHSYKEMLVLNTGFTRYLLRLVYEGEIPHTDGRIELTPRDCRSFLFRWIYATVNPGHQWLRDPVVAYAQYTQGQIDDPCDCDLEWMILTRLFSMRKRHVPIGELTTSFQSIGIRPEKLLAATYSLYNTNRPVQRHVELGKSEKLLQLSDVSPDTIAQITPLGSEFISSTLLKFEYWLQAILYPDEEHEDSPAMLRGIEHQSRTAVDAVYDRLHQVKAAHVAALSRIRKALGSVNDWEERYRRQFCIGRRLSLERIAINHWHHLRELDHETAEHAKALYLRLLTEYYEEASLSGDPHRLLGV